MTIVIVMILTALVIMSTMIFLEVDNDIISGIDLIIMLLSMTFDICFIADGFAEGWTEAGRNERYIEERNELIEDFDNADSEYIRNVVAEKIYEFNKAHEDNKDLFISLAGKDMKGR